MSGGGHHHLVALDLTTAPPSLGTPLLQVNVPRTLFDIEPKAETKPPDLDEPLTLKEACAHYGNRFTPSTLRAARDRDEIAFERLGNKDFITIRTINAWRQQRCRSKAEARISISGERGEATEHSPTSPAGSSATERVKLAQASAMARANKLKKHSPTTSPKNISPHESAGVIPLRSRWRT
jgi:hypothetical protein